MEESRFQKNNEAFECMHCHTYVSPHASSSRDHCTFCLYGRHVDIYPGDRKNHCKAMLEPVGISMRDGKKKIIYHCIQCGAQVLNVIAEDDNQEVVLDLSTAIWKS